MTTHTNPAGSSGEQIKSPVLWPGFFVCLRFPYVVLAAICGGATVTSGNQRHTCWSLVLYSLRVVALSEGA